MTVHHARRGGAVNLLDRGHAITAPIVELAAVGQSPTAVMDGTAAMNALLLGNLSIGTANTTHSVNEQPETRTVAGEPSTREPRKKIATVIADRLTASVKRIVNVIASAIASHAGTGRGKESGMRTESGTATRVVEIVIVVIGGGRRRRIPSETETVIFQQDLPCRVVGMIHGPAAVTKALLATSLCGLPLSWMITHTNAVVKRR